MKTLIIDTSTNTASVAVFDEKTLLGEFMLNTPLTHSQKLMPMVDSLLNTLHLKIKDFNLLIACEGPGSFTGVRIGLSTVKAFAQPYNIPIITETSLSLLAGGFPGWKGIILSMLDAKREDVYFGVMRWEGNTLIKLEEDVENINELLIRITETYANEQLLLVGDGLEIYEDAIAPYLIRSNIVTAVGAQNIPRASHFAYLVGDFNRAGDYNNAKANYMRKSQAERDMKRKDL